jgi:hypothetical protein
MRVRASHASRSLGRCPDCRRNLRRNLSWLSSAGPEPWEWAVRVACVARHPFVEESIHAAKQNAAFQGRASPILHGCWLMPCD